MYGRGYINNQAESLAVTDALDFPRSNHLD